MGGGEEEKKRRRRREEEQEMDAIKSITILTSQVGNTLFGFDPRSSLPPVRIIRNPFSPSHHQHSLKVRSPWQRVALVRALLRLSETAGGDVGR